MENKHSEDSLQYPFFQNGEISIKIPRFIHCQKVGVQTIKSLKSSWGIFFCRGENNVTWK